MGDISNPVHDSEMSSRDVRAVCNGPAVPGEVTGGRVNAPIGWQVSISGAPAPVRGAGQSAMGAAGGAPTPAKEDDVYLVPIHEQLAEQAHKMPSAFQFAKYTAELQAQSRLSPAVIAKSELHPLAAIRAHARRLVPHEENINT